MISKLRWKAPEVMTIKPKFTFEADVFSFAIVLWEIATFNVPYLEIDDIIIKDGVLEGERLDIPSEVPDEFKSLIEMCWVHKPNQRPVLFFKVK